MVWFRVPKGIPLIPAPIDPYFGPGSDSRQYWARMMQGILNGQGGRRGVDPPVKPAAHSPPGQSGLSGALATPARAPVQRG